MNHWSHETIRVPGDKRSSATRRIPSDLFLCLLLMWAELLFSTVTIGWELRALPLQQSAHTLPTSLQLCGQGHRSLNKYVLMPHRRLSYFVWECKCMCVIPLCYINAMSKWEWIFTQTCTRTHKVDLLNVNKYWCGGIFISAQTIGVLHVIQPQRWCRSHICNMHAWCRMSLNSNTLFNIHTFFFAKE